MKFAPKEFSLLIAISLIFGSGASLEAKSKKEKEESHSQTVARQLTGEPVKLLDSMPPFMVWRAEKPKGNLICLHELGMYNGVFEDLGKSLSKEGYTVYSMDLRGFGGWSDPKYGKDGQMDLKNTLSDIKSAAEELKKREPQTPVFLLGEAMGGALALEAAAKFKDLIAGIISSAPGGEHFGTLNNYTTVGSRFIAGNKRFNKGEKLVEIATPKKELQEALKQDPKVRLNLEPRELMACQFYMYKTKKFARQIASTPVLIVQGEKDGESRPEGARKIYDKLATSDKQYLNLPNGDHYVFEDTKVDNDAMKATIAWLDKRTSSKTN